jgi:DNA-binding transcriptional ArsR family regulator
MPSDEFEFPDTPVTVDREGAPRAATPIQAEYPQEPPQAMAAPDAAAPPPSPGENGQCPSASSDTEIVQQKHRPDIDWSPDYDACLTDAEDRPETADELESQAKAQISTWPQNPPLDEIELLFEDLIYRGATALVRGRVIKAIVTYCGADAFSKRDLLSTWTQIANEIARTDVSQRSVVTEPELTPEELKARQQELWTKCRHIAELDDIFAAAEEMVHALGVVGESALIRLVYAAGSSRILSNPINPLVKGASSGGKSFVSGNVLELFPSEDVIAMSSSSALSLVYREGGLSHKIISVFEATPLQREDNSIFAMNLRCLMSEGRIIHEVTVRDEDAEHGFSTHRIEREGPIALIVTTTADSIHEENETRMLSFRVTETPDHTTAIFGGLAKIAAGKADRGLDLEPWLDFQRWLTLGPPKAVVPFAEELVTEIKPLMVRYRRDVGSLLSLIKTSAIVHQATRELDDEGCVIAKLDDYANVRGIMSVVMTQSAGKAPSETVRRVVEFVDRELLEKAGPEPTSRRKGRRSAPSVDTSAHFVELSNKRIGEAIGVDRSTASRAISKAVEAGYLVNLQQRKGVVAQLTKGLRPLDAHDDDLLPTVEELHDAGH